MALPPYREEEGPAVIWLPLIQREESADAERRKLFLSSSWDRILQNYSSLCSVLRDRPGERPAELSCSLDAQLKPANPHRPDQTRPSREREVRSYSVKAVKHLSLQSVKYIISVSTESADLSRAAGRPEGLWRQGPNVRWSHPTDPAENSCCCVTFSSLLLWLNPES
ncbi:hypothetical protein MHYP_G00302420 [Metynnis hypsauchen]